MESVSFYTRSKIKKDSDIVISVLIRDTAILIRLSTGVAIPGKSSERCPLVPV